MMIKLTRMTRLARIMRRDDSAKKIKTRMVRTACHVTGMPFRDDEKLTRIAMIKLMEVDEKKDEDFFEVEDEDYFEDEDEDEDENDEHWREW